MAQPGGVNGAELASRDKDDLGGTGGSSGGTRAGRGEPSGGVSDRQAGGMLGATPFGAGAGSLAGLDGGGIAAEAAALGAADGSLADSARGEGRRCHLTLLQRQKKRRPEDHLLYSSDDDARQKLA